jgi:hypothetical protein
MTHVALWSHSQKTFHVEETSKMLDRNWEAYARNKKIDYLPLMLGSESDCREFINRLSKKNLLRGMFAGTGQ